MLTRGSASRLRAFRDARPLLNHTALSCQIPQTGITCGFPPGVTVKDYSWPSGSGLGYLNPKRGAQPERFKTIIQLVPIPAATR